uniref:Uncharacterized protein n=1 Tax=Megaselia scalaris TaxID=36166 RepID=T1GJ54_MEGSC
MKKQFRTTTLIYSEEIEKNSLSKTLRWTTIGVENVTENKKLFIICLEDVIILDNGKTALYWNRTVINDLTIQHKRPDILMHNKLNNN